MSPKSDTPKWQKPDEVITAAFDAALARLPEVERRKMFGMPCAFVRGNMFSGLLEQRMMLRLSAEDRTGFLANVPDSTPFSPRPGMEMREYVSVPEAVWSDSKLLQEWIEKAYTYALSLPPKVKKSRKK
jgi:TfoX/Sxy family transcriptional regulator of competence genes